jgi:hypothetical protein
LDNFKKGPQTPSNMYVTSGIVWDKALVLG